jgi:hypothetical protein
VLASRLLDEKGWDEKSHPIISATSFGKVLHLAAIISCFAYSWSKSDFRRFDLYKRLWLPFYMSDLRRSFETYPEDDTIKHFPPIQNTTLIRRIGELPPLFLPLLLIGTWVFLLIKELA